MCPSGIDRQGFIWESPASQTDQISGSYDKESDTTGKSYNCDYVMSSLDPWVAGPVGPFSWIDPSSNLGSMYPGRYVDSKQSSDPTHIGYAKEFMVEQPSAVGLVADGCTIMSYGNFGHINLRHGADGASSTNWLFMDGHAANIKKGLFPDMTGNAWNPVGSIQQPQFEVRVTLRHL